MLKFWPRSAQKIAWNPRLNRKYFTEQLFLRCETGHFWDDSFRAAILSIHCMHSANKTLKQTKAFRCAQKSRSRETTDRYWDRLLILFFLLRTFLRTGLLFFAAFVLYETTKCNKLIWNMDALKLNEYSIPRCDQQPLLLCAQFFSHYNIIV